MPWIWRFVSVMPSTNARIGGSIILAMLTGLTYLAHALAIAIFDSPLAKEWEPSQSWLGFLLLYSGIDAAQFFGKRVTSAEYVAAKAGTPPKNPPAEPAKPEIGT